MASWYELGGRFSSVDQQARLQKGCLGFVCGGVERCSRKGCESPEVDPCGSRKECPWLQKGACEEVSET